MRILFCNIAYQKYYQGPVEGEIPLENGGSYVKENRDGAEIFNFMSYELSQNGVPMDGRYCLGFAMVQNTSSSMESQLHIEKIEGCAGAAKEPYVDDVLVVYCATHPTYKFTTVVGWYKHARVFRYQQGIVFGEGNDDWQSYNAMAKAEDCVLLPISLRSRKTEWQVPRRNKGMAFGFGRSNIWFAQNPNHDSALERYLEKIQKQILEYQGENWRDIMVGSC